MNGELTQLFAARGINGSRANYYRRINAKTASLFEMSALAATMVSTQDETASLMKTYGYEIGMAFQIMDDVLDFSGEQATMGKPVGSDLLQGLVTLPAIYYAESAPDDPDVKLLAEGGLATRSEWIDS